MPPSVQPPSSSALPSIAAPLSVKRLQSPSLPATTDDYVLLVAHHVSQQFLNEGRFVGDASGALRLCGHWHKASAAAAAASTAQRARSQTASGSDCALSVSSIVNEISMNPVDCVEGKHDLSSRPPSAVPLHKHHKTRQNALAMETQRAVNTHRDVVVTNPLLIQSVDEQILYDKVVFLTHIAVFARLPLSTLIYISAALEHVMFDTQEALTFQDDDDATVYMLISGSVVAKVNHDSQTDRRRSKDTENRSVHEGKRRYLATRRHHYIDVVTFGPYGVCGDEAVIGHHRRIYSLIATSQVSAYAINFAQLWQLLDANTQKLLYDMAQYNHAVRQRTILLASKRSAAYKDSPIAFQHFLDQKVHRKLQQRNAETPQLPPTMSISRPGSRRYRPEHVGNGAVDYFIQASVKLQLTKNPTDNEATPNRLKHKLEALHADIIERAKMTPLISELNAPTTQRIPPVHTHSPHQQQDNDTKWAIAPIAVSTSPQPLPLPLPTILPPSLPPTQPLEPIVATSLVATSSALYIVEDELSHNRFIIPKQFITAAAAAPQEDTTSLSTESSTPTAAAPLILSIFDDIEVSNFGAETSEQSFDSKTVSQATSVFSSRHSSVSALNRPFALSTISFSSKVRRKASASAPDGEEKKELPRVSLTSVVAVSRALLEAGDINNPLVDPRIRAVYFFGEKNKPRQRRR